MEYIDDIRHWVIPDLLKRGKKAFEYYISLYSSQPSYRQLFDNQEYADLMEEKINCCYEQVIAKYGYNGKAKIIQ